MKKIKCHKCKKYKPVHEFQLLSKAPKSTMTNVYSSSCYSCVEIIKRENPRKTTGFM